ncbi:hypothetical protein GCM10010260_71900 [Streptomyces filipinensis]|uniref:Uncharacterized protein n=1 Tax=Streptomyces filipinensis TaxID=66887 RepID=A0A918IJM6_9ACTN|nr:hypothetical protein [Streptomyces filipinensis]GGV21307.1 hypothetical protein GCM10010260_71900 [Streptomyces filipinensis]
MTSRPSPALRRALESTSPGLPRPLYDMAAVLSVAVRIEPELVRTVRRSLFPWLDVDAEADFWFSDLVVSRGTKGVLLEPQARRNLHAHLAQLLAARPPADRLHTAWSCIDRVHAHLSPALRLEEHITWLALSGRPDEIDAALAPALKAVIVQERGGVAKWFASAWDRLPPAAQQTSAAWKLAHVALDRRPSAVTPLVPPPAMAASDLYDVVHLLQDVDIGVRRTAERLEVGDLRDGRGGYSIAVPDTSPRLLTLVDPSGTADQHLVIDPGAVVSRPVGPQPLRLRTARGVEYELLAPARRGRRLFLAIGTRADSGPGARSDAQRLAAVLRDSGYETRTQEDLWGLWDLPAGLSSLVVLISGHGSRRTADGKQFVTLDGSDGQVPADRPPDPGRSIALDELGARLGAASAERELLLLDLCDALGTDASHTAPPAAAGPGEWRGVIVAHRAPESDRAPSLAGQVCALLSDGPSSPGLVGWAPDQEYITGEDLFHALRSEEARSRRGRSSSCATTGRSGALFRNPLFRPAARPPAAAEPSRPAPGRRAGLPPVTDLVVVLPTFMASTLRRGDEPVWDISSRTAWRWGTRPDRSLRALSLAPGIGDGPADDGIAPVRLQPTAQLLPGLITLSTGYDKLLARLRHLGCRDVSADRASPPGNLLPIAYDWRLSHRWVGRWLGTLVEPALERWRAQGGPYSDAKVVFVCHGTGGLPARWYVSVLGGAVLTRRLIMIGTPLRGVPKMVRQMVHGSGPRVFGERIGSLLRTLPSAYQVLPQYACVERGEELFRIDEVSLPPLDRARVREGMLFTDELLAAESSSADDRPREQRIIGTGQPTPTTLRITDGVVTLLDTYRGEDFSGDSTVPLLSTVRPGESFPPLFRVQARSDNLHAHPHVLDTVAEAVTARRPLSFR